jgi:hypothetical protein
MMGYSERKTTSKFSSFPRWRNLKWNKELIFDLLSTQALNELQSLIYQPTNTLRDQQNLIRLKLKTSGIISNTTAADELNLSSKIMLIDTYISRN